MIVLPPLVVAVLSAVALVLLLAHRRANLGSAATTVFVGAAAAYGWLRASAIGLLSASAHADAPYRIVTPLVAVGGVPLQELVGWISAVALAGYLADRLLRGHGRPADPWSTALVAGMAMAAICLAVESAAVSAGWWSWSLAHSATALLRFPAIALLDWGFVAFDFLLPFELWRRRAPLGERIAGLLFFPLHLAGHALTGPVWTALPLAGFDLVHVALIAAVAGLAFAPGGRNADSPWPATAGERWRPAALVGGGLIGLTTAAQLVMLGEWRQLWSGLPLAAAIFASAAAKIPTAVRRDEKRRYLPAAWIFLTILAGGLFLRLPEALRARDFEQLVGRGVAALASGDLAAARRANTSRQRSPAGRPPSRRRATSRCSTSWRGGTATPRRSSLGAARGTRRARISPT